MLAGITCLFDILGSLLSGFIWALGHYLSTARFHFLSVNLSMFSTQCIFYFRYSAILSSIPLCFQSYLTLDVLTQLTCAHMFHVDLFVALFAVNNLYRSFVVAHVSLVHNITVTTLQLKRLAESIWCSFALTLSFIDVNVFQPDFVLHKIFVFMSRPIYTTCPNKAYAFISASWI